MIRVKRVYEAPAKSDGIRILVDRLWPRGLEKNTLPLDGWLKDVAPSNSLRRWFSHDTSRWAEFRRRYFDELDGNPETWKPIPKVARDGNVTLLYSASDPKHNNAIALQDYLVKRMRRL